MIRQRLENLLTKQRCTLLGVGPISMNCVDATIELSNDYQVPVMLIASRRQIDSEDFGNGYVNNWSTQKYAEYVIDRDKQGKIILARDHGGPWQSEKEKSSGMSLRRAMESAKVSFKADIEAGFQILHIDPSIDIHGHPSVDEVLDRMYELYEFCWSHAQKTGRDIIFEVGTEEQSGSTNNQEELVYILEHMKSFCNKNHIPFPAFVVIQTGTKVMEARNVGSFDYPVRIVDELPAVIQVPRMIDICRQYNIFIKVHNADYLSDDSLAWHPKLGIHSANVAPEFGVIETRAFITLLNDNNLSDLRDSFTKLAYESGKWKKWMLPETTATDMDRAIIAGHYVFADERFKEIKKKAQASIPHTDIDGYLKEQVKQGIMRYIKNFRLMRLQ